MDRKKDIETERGINLIQIHRKYGNFILDCIRLHGVKNDNDAADIRQDVYCALFARSLKNRLPTGSALKGYIFTATRNMVTDFRRTQRRENVLIDWACGETTHVSVKMDKGTFHQWWNVNDHVDERILRAIDFLDTYQPTEGVSMFEIIEDIYNGRSYAEIAERYQVSVGAFKSWLHRFRKKLRAYMRTATG